MVLADMGVLRGTHTAGENNSKMINSGRHQNQLSSSMTEKATSRKTQYVWVDMTHLKQLTLELAHDYVSIILVVIFIVGFFFFFGGIVLNTGHFLTEAALLSKQKSYKKLNIDPGHKNGLSSSCYNIILQREWLKQYGS